MPIRAAALALALLVANGCFSDPGAPQGGDEASATASAETTSPATATAATTDTTSTSTSGTSTSTTTAATSTTTDATTAATSTTTATTSTGADTDATGTSGGAGVDDICPALCLKSFECGQMVGDSCLIQCIAALSASSAACVDAYADLAQCVTPLACAAIDEGCRGPTNEVTLACQECETGFIHDANLCSVSFACTDAVYSMLCDDLGCVCEVDGNSTGFCPGLSNCALDDAALAELAIGCCDWSP